MKILIIVPAEYQGIGWGGVMTYSLLMAEKFSATKNECVILTPGKENKKIKYKKIIIYKIKFNNIKIFGQNILSKYCPLFLDRLQWMIGVYKFVQKKKDFDIIESSEWGSSALIISLLGRTKVNVRLHRSLLQYYNDNQLKINFDILLLNFLELASIVFANSVTSPTDYMFRSHGLITIILKIIGTPLKVIPNGIKILDIKNKNKNSPFFLTVGRLEYGKGFHLIIAAFKKIIEKYPKIKLLFIGRDMSMNNAGVIMSYKKYIYNLAKKNKIIGRLKIIQQQDQSKLNKYYKKCLACIVPSIGHENQPYAILDALRWNKFVIASDTGGIPELIEHNKNGFLFKENNPYSLAKMLLKFLENHKFCNKILKNNLEYCKKYNINKIVKMTSDFYKQSLSRKI